MLLTAIAGMWFFYVQHQFEKTSWQREHDWSIQDAALEVSSHFALPGMLRWITRNTGVHHVHHLASRIPFYRLPEVLRGHDVFANTRRITLRDSLRFPSLALWDETERVVIVSYETIREWIRNFGIQIAKHARAALQWPSDTMGRSCRYCPCLHPFLTTRILHAPPWLQSSSCDYENYFFLFPILTGL
ncbi:hypothetical protein DS906_06485 [Ruegeria sp. A3M17]|nr:hypothetical protein DS906_06485 [Ruegeria sp. A3M17]